MDPADRAKLVKDAEFLFELLRESPGPIVICIAPYAEKENMKPNTIVKRLAEIKKRNNLNIVTTTQIPEGSKLTLGANNDAGQAKVNAKRDRVVKDGKAKAGGAKARSAEAEDVEHEPVIRKKARKFDSEDDEEAYDMPGRKAKKLKTEADLINERE
ncbi:hypothetical protein A1O3_00064 [Capronia epimyces CBS 606.96]|uniref:Uncharacterized protein n=1 Tax=Capronia epimyces CBS 606.96 TaxID=1182542 RepID=W9YQI7_9EURO|nr:uncharacterized protein A1O3_00064 [Capronia epimyces CBS 606.96]EXJ91516.1 hypothetical protein A1O3_00064 [Capronia epimyces CBS 606.96]